MKHIATYAKFFAVSLLVILVATPLQASALVGTDFRPNRIIDDNVFYSRDTIYPSDIQAFLNSKVPVCDTNGQASKSYTYQGQYATTSRAVYAQRFGYPGPPYTCLKDFSQYVAAKSGDQYCTGSISAGTKSASQLIYDVGQACNVNPRVLLVLLQKEQSLVTDDWPWPSQYQSATGFGCPDTAACDASFSGFVSQVYYAARQYQIYAQHPDWFNYVAGANNYVLFNPTTSCGGSTLNIQTQATAGLYDYTPYQPNKAALDNLYGTGDSCSAYGNRNFWRMYNDWFGSSVTDRCLQPASSIGSTSIDLVKNSGVDRASLVIESGSSTSCVEFHTWNPGVTSWAAHTVSNQPGIDTSNFIVRHADIDGDGKDEPILVAYRNTGSGYVEFHVWNNDMKTWRSHIVSNLSSAVFDATNATVDFGDLNGDKKDEPVLILYRNTGSGYVEFHVWNNDMKTWRSHIASNQTGIDPTISTISFADLTGRGYDTAILTGFRGTGSGNVEFHVWNSWMQTWQSHIASNQPVIDSANSTIKFGDVNGRGYDQAVLIGLRNTGSGRVEFHTWNSWMQTWQSHIASNQTSLP